MMFTTIATPVRRMNVLAVAVGLAANLILGLGMATPISAKRWHAHGLHHHHHHHALRLHVGSAAWWRRMDRTAGGGRN
jgi:hypothetical protein